MRKAGRQTPGEHQTPRLQAGGAAGRRGAAAPARPPAPPAPHRRPPRPGPRSPPPEPRSSSRAPSPPPPGPPPPEVGGRGPRGLAGGRAGGGPGPQAGEGRQRRPAAPTPQPPPPRRGRERRTHPGDAMSAARSRRCRRLRFLRAERLRRGGASHRPPAARPGSSRRRGSGEGPGEGPGSAGDGCEWARSRRRVRPGIGSERAGGGDSGRGPGVGLERPGGGGGAGGTGLAPGTGAVRDPQPGPAHLPRCPGARRPGLAGRRLRCRNGRETAPGPRSSCRTQVKSPPPCGMSLISLRKAFSLAMEDEALLLVSKTITLLYLTWCAALPALLASQSRLHIVKGVSHHTVKP